MIEAILLAIGVFVVISFIVGLFLRLTGVEEATEQPYFR